MTVNTNVYTPGVLSQHVLSLTDRVAVLHNPLAHQIVVDIESKIASPQTVLSFDVFDTLLLRNHRAELTRFYDVSGLVASLLAQRYQESIRPEDVLMARLMANRLSYRLSPTRDGCREGTITDIYRLILEQLRVPATESTIQACIEIELAYEVTQLTVNLPLLAMTQHHIARGGRAIYVSDMYLGVAHINQLLTRLGVEVSLFAATYSSADTILSKRSGKIWPLILNELGITAAQMLHIGDSLVSDYQSPRTQGIPAVHVPIPLQMRRDIMADHGALVHQLESMHLPIQSWMAPPHW
jgi:predicted HAD superfamily hydrolase